MNLQAVAEEGMPKLVLMLRKGVKGFFFFCEVLLFTCILQAKVWWWGYALALTGPPASAIPYKWLN